MNHLIVFCSAFNLCAAIALLSGCGGSQPPISTPRTIGQSQATAAHPVRSASWILPEAKSEALIYVSKLTEVVVYSYPSDKIVGVLSGFNRANGLCSDHDGDVWVTDYAASDISEYAHAGTKPIAILSDAHLPVGCAVDPQTGDLAVANYSNTVYVYPKGSANPKVYSAPGFDDMRFCIYDGSGDLFVDGTRQHRGFSKVGILKLAYGATRLQRYEIGPNPNLQSPGPMQWDGSSLIMGYAKNNEHDVVYRISDLGSAGRITKRITFIVPDGGYIPGFLPFVLDGRTIIGTYSAEHYYIALWPYPKGGAALKEFEVHGKYYPVGLAISVAPSASR